LNEESKLVYHCKNCDNTEIPAGDTSLCVMDNSYIDDDTNYKQYMNKYLKYDPTLPRVNNIPCQNPKCNKPQNSPNEVIFVKYDFENMKYMYHCVYCEEFWKSQ
jgi:hypothetical protein